MGGGGPAGTAGFNINIKPVSVAVTSGQLRDDLLCVCHVVMHLKNESKLFMLPCILGTISAHTRCNQLCPFAGRYTGTLVKTKGFSHEIRCRKSKAGLFTDLCLDII